MAKFDYKKWVTENKHGKPIIYEQGVADFEVKEQVTTGSNTGSGGGTNPPTGSGTGSQGPGIPPTTGSWWCQGPPPGGQGSSCIQSPTQPTGATGPHPDQTACQANCGSAPTGSNTGSACMGMEVTATECANATTLGVSSVKFWCMLIGGQVPDQSYVGTAFQVNPTSNFVISAVDSPTTSPGYLSDFPVGTVCGPGGPGPGPGTGSCDFNYSGVSAQTYLNTGNAPSWNTWLGKRETGYNNIGCQHFTKVVNWITNQLVPTPNCPNGGNNAGNCWNNVQVARKGEKISWANDMWTQCGCGTIPEGMGSVYRINENKIKIPNKITKGRLKKIIKEELKKTLLNEQWSGEGCQSYLATSTQECRKCTSSQPTPYNPPLFGANMTGPQCQCCDDERAGGGDERGCTMPQGAGTVLNLNACCPGAPSGCVPNLHHEPCCEYERGRGEPCEGWPSTWGGLSTTQENICLECPQSNDPECHCCPPREEPEPCDKCCCEKDIMPMQEQEQSMCVGIWATKCAGLPGPSNAPQSQIGGQGHFPCPHIDGAFATPAHQGQQVKKVGATDGTVYCIDTVEQPNPNYPQYGTPNSYLETTMDSNCIGCAPGIIDTNTTITPIIPTIPTGVNTGDPGRSEPAFGGCKKGTIGPADPITCQCKAGYSVIASHYCKNTPPTTPIAIDESRKLRKKIEKELFGINEQRHYRGSCCEWCDDVLTGHAVGSIPPQGQINGVDCADWMCGNQEWCPGSKITTNPFTPKVDI